MAHMVELQGKLWMHSELPGTVIELLNGMTLCRDKCPDMKGDAWWSPMVELVSRASHFKHQKG